MQLAVAFQQLLVRQGIPVDRGSLLKGKDLPLGKDYLSLRARGGAARSSPELEAEIFNHLYAFFSRYYDDGDFMSLRRYSKRDKYAILYRTRSC